MRSISSGLVATASASRLELPLPISLRRFSRTRRNLFSSVFVIVSRPLVLSPASFLLRGGGFLPFHLHLVHHLLYVKDRGGGLCGARALGFRVNIASERDDVILDRVFYVVVKTCLDQGCIQIAFDTFVQVRVHVLGITLGAWRNHRNLIRHHLGPRDRLGNEFGLGLVRVCRDVSAQGHDALVAILHCRDVLEARLIERCANAVFYVGCFRGCRRAPDQSSGQQHRQHGQTRLKRFHIFSLD